jgi:hypothetical protein
MDKNRYIYFIAIPFLLLVHISVMYFWGLSIKADKTTQLVQNPMGYSKPFALKNKLAKF